MMLRLVRERAYVTTVTCQALCNHIRTHVQASIYSVTVADCVQFMLVWAEWDCLGPVYMSVCRVLQCYDLYVSALTFATELGLQAYVT